MATEEPTVVVDPTPEPAATESPPEEKEEPKSEAGGEGGAQIWSQGQEV